MIEEQQPEDSVELRFRLEKLRDQYLAFLSTEAHDHFVRSRKAEVIEIANAIVALDPMDRRDEIESFKMRGDMRTTEEFVTLFEDTLRSLDERIQQLLDAEQPTETRNLTDNETEETIPDLF